MRISDWSSDVCSSDLAAAEPKPEPPFEVGVVTVQPQRVPVTTELPGRTSAYLVAPVRARVSGIVLRRQFKEGGTVAIGRASCRERVCQDVLSSVVAVSLKKK